MDDSDAFLIGGPEVATEWFCQHEIVCVVRGWGLNGVAKAKAR